MRDNKRGTIEDPSTDRVLALAFEQEKQERLLDETAHSVRVSEELAKEIPPLVGGEDYGYGEYSIEEEHDGFHLYRRGWSCGYVFRNLVRAEQAQTALNNAIALDFCER